MSVGRRQLAEVAINAFYRRGGRRKPRRRRIVASGPSQQYFIIASNEAPGWTPRPGRV